MARKKIRGQKLQQENENVKEKNYVQENNLPLTIRNNPLTTIQNCSPISSPIKEDKTCSFDTCSNEKKNDTPILYNVSNKIDGIDGNCEHANTDVQVVTSQKRKREESFDLILDENNSDEFIRLKKKCLDLEKRVEVLESALMPYSEDLNMVENIFGGIVEDINHDRIVINDDKKMLDLNNELNINSEILNGLKQDSSTTTARAILKYLYPRPSPNFKLSDIDPTTAAYIVACSKNCHPDDRSTTKQIRRSMSNYFASIKHRKKRKTILLNAGGGRNQ
ncbi:unnamed protein product [Adineta steineri]|uniref:BEN domain-containing protein n=1 Tax=Adineta steineri TaxID=433720 RepID=A0A813XZ05_9BILA|nr:unnamed protein product [Adineta steineri]